MVDQIRHGNDYFAAIRRGAAPIARVYRGANLLWPPTSNVITGAATITARAGGGAQFTGQATLAPSQFVFTPGFTATATLAGSANVAAINASGLLVQVEATAGAVITAAATLSGGGVPVSIAGAATLTDLRSPWSSGFSSGFGFGD